MKPGGRHGNAGHTASRGRPLQREVYKPTDAGEAEAEDEGVIVALMSCPADTSAQEPVSHYCVLRNEI